VTVSRATAATRATELIDRARGMTGLDDFGADTWREGFEVIVGSAVAEGRFNELGERRFYGWLVQTLVNRLRIEDWYARHPEIDEQDVFVELLGVGFPRTGSTALAHLLGEDRAVRSLRMWEASVPCPPPGISEEEDRARMAAAEAAVQAQQRLAPRMRSMLPQSGTGPIEDHDLLALEFKAQVFLAFARIPSYADWLLHCDMEPTYRYERRVLKLLQWRCPPTRWQLKSPTHTLFLDAYATVFPEARFVMTHRDVAHVLPSVCDLYATVRRSQNIGADADEIRELNMVQWGTAVDRILAFRAAGRDDKFFDVGFSAFQDDPIAEIRALYAWLGRDLSEETAERMRAWRASNPREERGSLRDTAAEFGITDGAIEKRFGAYRARFASLLG
jgi:hypothetical protein